MFYDSKYLNYLLTINPKLTNSWSYYYLISRKCVFSEHTSKWPQWILFCFYVGVTLFCFKGCHTFLPSSHRSSFNRNRNICDRMTKPKSCEFAESLQKSCEKKVFFMIMVVINVPSLLKFIYNLPDIIFRVFSKFFGVDIITLVYNLLIL